MNWFRILNFRLWRENKNSVALKIHSDIFTHKTEINGVAINLDNETTIRKKADEFLKISDKKQIIIQSMIQDNGVEVFAGISLDNSFGLCMSIGLGGIFVETLKEENLPKDEISYIPADSLRLRCSKA